MLPINSDISLLFPLIINKLIVVAEALVTDLLVTDLPVTDPLVVADLPPLNS